MAINYLLVFATLLLFCGFAVDLGNLQYQKQKMQKAADAAALGALFEKNRGLTDWVTAGQDDAALNGFSNGSGGVTVSVISPPTSGSYTSNTSAVQAKVSMNAPVMFVSSLGFSKLTLNAYAVAQPGQGTDCVYALDKTMSRSLMLSGTANFGCGVYVDSSNSSDALHIDGGGSLTASGGINIVGGYTNSGTISPNPPTTGASQVSDPLAYITQPPAPSSCTYTNTSITTSRTLSPGVYCGGITISNGAKVTLNSGLYTIAGGINWNDGSTITGDGVTLFFTKYSSYGYGQVTVSGSVNLNLSAPTTSSGGDIAGILMFGDRNWTSTAQNVNFNGATITKLEGVLYFPGTGVIFSTGSTSSNGNYLSIVADNITINGGASVTLPTPNYGSISGGSPFKNGVVLAE